MIWYTKQASDYYKQQLELLDVARTKSNQWFDTPREL